MMCRGSLCRSGCVHARLQALCLLWELKWNVLLYMCCFYWLMNKAALAYGRAEYSQPGRDMEREYAQSRRRHVADKGERHWKILLVGHSLVVIHRLIEMF